MATCEDKVSENLYRYFATKSKFKVIHWHPPGGKKYFTPHLRIPLFRHGVRKGRELIDLILCRDNLLLLIECKCNTSESENDVTKLRSIRDTVGLVRLNQYFRRQGADTGPADTLVLGLGVRSIDSETPEEFITFVSAAPGLPELHFGRDVPQHTRTHVNSLLT